MSNRDIRREVSPPKLPGSGLFCLAQGNGTSKSPAKTNRATVTHRYRSKEGSNIYYKAHVFILF